MWMNGAWPCICRSELAREKLKIDAGCQVYRVVLTTFASELAPTGLVNQKWKLVLSNAVRPAAWLAKWVENALS